MSKSHFFTEKEKVTGKVSIWAIPKAKYEMNEDDPNDKPFRYELRTDKPWDEGTTKVCEEEMELFVPAGIDLLQATIATLKERQQSVLAEAQKKSNELKEKMDQLMLLTHQPDPISGMAPIRTTVDSVFGEDTVNERANEAFDKGDFPF